MQAEGPQSKPQLEQAHKWLLGHGFSPGISRKIAKKHKTLDKLFKVKPNL